MAHSRICTIPDCGNRAHAKGWCSKHYMKALRYGDPLIAKTRETGEAARFIHEVVLPFEGQDCLPWPYLRNREGYGRCYWDGRIWLVSRLICTLVFGAPPTVQHEAAHACGKGDEGCVNPNHLAWKTPEENAFDKIAHGTQLRGERHHQSKLTEDQVHRIRALKGKHSQPEIARMFDVSPITVFDIHHRRSWAWLP